MDTDTIQVKSGCSLVFNWLLLIHTLIGFIIYLVYFATWLYALILFLLSFIPLILNILYLTEHERITTFLVQTIKLRIICVIYTILDLAVVGYFSYYMVQRANQIKFDGNLNFSIIQLSFIGMVFLYLFMNALWVLSFTGHVFVNESRKAQAARKVAN